LLGANPNRRMFFKKGTYRAGYNWTGEGLKGESTRKGEGLAEGKPDVGKRIVILLGGKKGQEGIDH